MTTTKNKIHVLNENQGYVELWYHYPDKPDDMVCDAARISKSDAEKRSRNDRLIRYLMRNEHMSPFEQPHFTFRIKAPIFVARQWFRHRTGKPNEESARYSKIKSQFYIPNQYRAQDTTNMQGSAHGGLGQPQLNDHFVRSYIDVCENAFALYNKMLDAGVAREMARMHLPQSTMTTFIWTQDLRNLLHLIHLRADNHAQLEIQEYASAVLQLIRPFAPTVIAAWEDYVLNSITIFPCEIHLAREQTKVRRIVKEFNTAKGNHGGTYLLHDTNSISTSGETECIEDGNEREIQSAKNSTD